MVREPKHFSKEDIFYSFFGALFVGLVFTLKGLLIDIAKSLTTSHIIAIIILTILLITVQIYYVGYVHVKEKEKRRFGQFWAKRFVTIYVVSILTSFILVYLYGINLILANFADTIKAVIAISMPCALGATLSDLFKKIKF